MNLVTTLFSQLDGIFTHNVDIPPRKNTFFFNTVLLKKFFLIGYYSPTKV